MNEEAALKRTGASAPGGAVGQNLLGAHGKDVGVTKMGQQVINGVFFGVVGMIIAYILWLSVSNLVSFLYIKRFLK